MSSISYSKRFNRWRVRWYPEGARTQSERRFTTRDQAAMFASGLDDPRGRTSVDWDNPTSVRKFIAARIRIEHGCWVWTAALSTHGYPRSGRRIGTRLVTQPMHRRSYEAHVAAIPAGLTIDHLCGVRACVNPQHLEPVTLAENVRRATSKAGQSARADWKASQ